MPVGQPSVIFEPKDIVLTTGYEARGIRVESNRLDMRYALRVDVSELFNWSVKEVCAVGAAWASLLLHHQNLCF